jgi:hypothetical protein
MSPPLRVLSTLFVISFALDFKGAEGGSSVQFVMAGINAIAFLLIAVSYRMGTPRRRFGAFIFWGWFAFLLTGTLGAFVNGTPTEQFVRVIYPYALFLQGFIVAYWIARSQTGAETLISAMTIAAVVSLFFTFIWGLYFTGHGFEEIRYEILSPLIPLLMIIASYDLLLARRRRLFSFALLILMLAVIALSVTRGMFLFVGFVVGVVLFAMLRNAVRYGNFPRPVIQALVWTLLIGVISMTVALAVYPDTLGRWILRSSGEVSNVTLWTRVAAVAGQFQVLTDNSIGWFIGEGFGSSYPWLVSMFPWILPYLSPEMNSSAWFPGEFMWMPFIYYGGFIVGPLVALGLVLSAVRSFRLLCVLLKEQTWRRQESRPLWIGILGFFSFIGMGFTHKVIRRSLLTKNPPISARLNNESV